MTTLYNLGQERLREQHTEEQAAEDAAYEKEQRRIKSRTRVIYLFMRDVLKGAELPRGATIGMRVSNEHGHQITVRFPGNLSIDAEHLYTTDATGGALVCRKDQRWTARVHPCGAQKTYDDFIDAAIWLLGIELEEPPEAPPLNITEPSIKALVGRVIKRVSHIGPTAYLETSDGLILDVAVEQGSYLTLSVGIRCQCNGHLRLGRDGDAPLYCAVCGDGWDTIEEFLAWRAGATEKKPVPQPAMPELFNAALVAVTNASSDDPRGDILALRKALDRFLCTCGKFPTEGSIHGYWCVRCCGKEWDCWEDFLAWRGTQDEKAT